MGWCALIESISCRLHWNSQPMTSDRIVCSWPREIDARSAGHTNTPKQARSEGQQPKQAYHSNSCTGSVLKPRLELAASWLTSMDARHQQWARYGRRERCRQSANETIFRITDQHATSLSLAESKNAGRGAQKRGATLIDLVGYGMAEGGSKHHDMTEAAVESCKVPLRNQGVMQRGI